MKNKQTNKTKQRPEIKSQPVQLAGLAGVLFFHFWQQSRQTSGRGFPLRQAPPKKYTTHKENIPSIKIPPTTRANKNTALVETILSQTADELQEPISSNSLLVLHDLAEKWHSTKKEEVFTSIPIPVESSIDSMRHLSKVISRFSSISIFSWY